MTIAGRLVDLLQELLGDPREVASREFDLQPFGLLRDHVDRIAYLRGEVDGILGAGAAADVDVIADKDAGRAGPGRFGRSRGRGPRELLEPPVEPQAAPGAAAADEAAGVAGAGEAAGVAGAPAWASAADSGSMTSARVAAGRARLRTHTRGRIFHLQTNQEHRGNMCLSEGRRTTISAGVRQLKTFLPSLGPQSNAKTLTAAPVTVDIRPL